jgi:uncharacterized protein
MPRITKAALKQEVLEIFDQVNYLLELIANDNGVPRNIRKTAQESIETVANIDDNDNSPAVVASTCVSNLEDIAQDLNCPLHTRTQIYNILSLLEQVRDY